MRWAVSVYDCNVNLKSEKLIRDEMVPIVTYLPKLMSKYKPLADKFVQNVKTPFNYEGRVAKLNQNTRS